MATANMKKTYGKELQVREDIELSNCILASISVTPSFSVTTYGNPAIAGVRRLNLVEYSGEAVYLKDTTAATIETAIETWCSGDAPDRFPNMVPAGGSTIVEIGQEQLIDDSDDDSRKISFKASYYPKMTSTTA